MKRCRRVVVGIALAITAPVSARAELPATTPLGPNFDEGEWDALPFEIKKAIVLDESDAHRAVLLGLSEQRAAQLSNLLFRTQIMEVFSEHYFYVARSCSPDLAQEFADLSTVIPVFWDHVNAHLKNRFPEADPTNIDRVMRAGRAKAIMGRPRWPRDSKLCTELRDRDEKDLHAERPRAAAAVRGALLSWPLHLAGGGKGQIGGGELCLFLPA